MTFQITTEHLLIRPLRFTDSASVFRYRSDPEVVRYQMWRPARESEVRRFIRELQGLAPGMPGIWYQFAIVEHRSECLIGDCGIHVPLEAIDAAELGMTITPEFQGRGYATEALEALIAYCFQTLHMRTIIARTVPQNTRSLALIARTGFTPSVPGRLGLEATEGEEFFLLRYTTWRDRHPDDKDSANDGEAHAAENL
ncbi:MAG: GNAT family N-acetyltransferase [Bacteroidetes bacterium]|nr:GNAT family N-acetyltransferase [Bacteroidota bacterium]